MKKIKKSLKKENKPKAIYVPHQEKEAYLKGIYSRLAGEPHSKQPYETISMCHKWLQGWKDGVGFLVTREQEQYNENDDAEKRIAALLMVDQQIREGLFNSLKDKLAKEAGIV